MSWEGYQAVHKVLRELELPAGDSFWLFDPSGGDMGLFTHDLAHKGPRHNELLDDIASGRLDVLHSVGSYGARFNQGFRPNRALVEGALEYLAKHAKVPQIWSNHGDQFNTQNIGGAEPAPHHKGDDPASDIYILDLLLGAGIEYFWLDRLIYRDPALPYRTVSKERCRSGAEIRVFARYLSPTIGYSPNAHNLHQQLSPEEFEKLIKVGQNPIIYSHWGCAHEGTYAVTPEGNPLSQASRESLERLADLHAKGEVVCTRLYDLLQKEESLSLQSEAQRIASVVVADNAADRDTFYFNQYNKHTVSYFEKRIDQLGVSGEAALDAACGVGQWAFALAERFAHVDGIDINPAAGRYLNKISEQLRQSSPQFKSGSIETLPYPNFSYDFVMCYGAIMCTDVEQSLREIWRVLRPGGIAYINLNGDGWYDFCIEQRFANEPDLRHQHVLPIWNATFHRAGGKKALRKALRQGILKEAKEGADADYARQFLGKLLEAEACLPEVRRAIREYSGLTVLDLYAQALMYLKQLEQEPEELKGMTAVFASFFRRVANWMPNTFRPKNADSDGTDKPVQVAEVPTGNRPYLPPEFEQLGSKIGFIDFKWGPDATVSASDSETRVSPIYAANHRRQVAVWECLLRKPVDVAQAN